MLKKMLADLSDGARKFLVLQMFYSGISTIVTLFINTFLLNSFGSYSKEVLLYNIILAAAQPAAMVTAILLTQVKNALLTAESLGFPVIMK